MKIYGYEVPKKVENAALAAMTDCFVARDIEDAVINAGAPYEIKEYFAVRIADRLLQRERKAGNISFNGKNCVRINGV